MQAVDVVKRYMDLFKYAVYDGAVYKKVKDSTFTYIFCSTVKDFLMHILGNVEVADQIATYVGQLTNLLSEKSCQLIKPIVIDTNYIECLPEGMCFSIPERIFVMNPKDLKGSPRAFVKYQYTGKVPYPKPFIEGKFLYQIFSLLIYYYYY